MHEMQRFSSFMKLDYNSQYVYKYCIWCIFSVKQTNAPAVNWYIMVVTGVFDVVLHTKYNKEENIVVSLCISNSLFRNTESQLMLLRLIFMLLL